MTETKHDPYATAEESLSVMGSATAAQSEVARLIDAADLNEQGITDRQYARGVVDICVALVEQRNGLLKISQLARDVFVHQVQHFGDMRERDGVLFRDDAEKLIFWEKGLAEIHAAIAKATGGTA